jgi:drug/metabolite transporter (DMT)-like permease
MSDSRDQEHAPHDHDHDAMMLEEPLLGDSREKEEEDVARSGGSCASTGSTSTPEADAIPTRTISDDDGDDQEGYSYRGRWLLGIVAFLYSTLNVSFRFLYLLPDPPSASVLSTTRGWMALACFLPFIMVKRKAERTAPTSTPSEDSDASPRPSISIWLAAGELAFWNFACQALFNLGLLTVPSARASFLGQTSVVLVPLISALAGEKLRGSVWLGCCASLIGLGCLSYQDTTSSTSLGFGVGDLLVLGGACCWSLYVFRVSAVARYYDEVYLQGTKTLYLAILYSAWFLISSLRVESSLWSGWDNWVAWAILAYSALGPGAIADLLQQKGQEAVGATESNLILCMEPVFTAILGRLILGEETSWLEKLGGGFLIFGALVSTRA